MKELFQWFWTILTKRASPYDQDCDACHNTGALKGEIMSMPEIKKQMKWMLIGLISLTFFYFIEYQSRLSEYDRLDDTRNDVKRDRLMMEEKLREQWILTETDYLLSKHSFEISGGKDVNQKIVAIMDKLPYLPEDK